MNIKLFIISIVVIIIFGFLRLVNRVILIFGGCFIIWWGMIFICMFGFIFRVIFGWVVSIWWVYEVFIFDNDVVSVDSYMVCSKDKFVVW